MGGQSHATLLFFGPALMFWYPFLMKSVARYPIPARESRIEYPVSDSRFIATGAYTPSVERAEDFLERVRGEFAAATHNCVAWRIGYQKRVNERMSDDGEPSGTAGRPMLAVLQGQDIGDVAVVVTRYFGGTKLGMGGLVRAYSGAVRDLLKSMPLTMRVERARHRLVVDYPRYEMIKRFIEEREGKIKEEQFAAEITLDFSLPVDRIELFEAELTQLTHGQIATSPLAHAPH